MRTLILSPARAKRTLSRLAYEIVERNRGAETLEVVGILRSGQPLAEALAAEIATIEDRPLQAHPLDVTRFRDDRTNGEAQPHDAAADDGPALDLDVAGRDVILVDDVLFTGRTARAAMDAVVQSGRPASIQLAVLVDRGHREYPIRPDYVGRTLPTKHRERVTVEAGAPFAVYVEE